MPATTPRDHAARATVAGMVSDIASERVAQREQPVGRDDKRPTGKQTYRAFYLLCEIAGIPAPKTSREASELIGRLTEQRDALNAAQTDTAPF